MKNTNIEFHFANPAMPVRDIKEAAKYYKNILGLSIDVIWKQPNHVGSSACVVAVTNLDELYQELVDQGATFESDFVEQDYGSNDFRIRDHDGNLLVFVSTLPNKDKLIENRNVA